MAGNKNNDQDEVVEKEEDIMRILYGLQDPNSSDIEFLTDIESEEEDDSMPMPSTSTHKTRDVSQSEVVDTTVYSETVILLPDENIETPVMMLPNENIETPRNDISESSVDPSRPVIWYPKKDNDFSGNPPPFSDTVTWTLSNVSRCLTSLFL